MGLSSEYDITLRLGRDLTVAERFLLKKSILSGLAESTYTGDYEIDIPTAEEIDEETPDQ